MDRQTDHRRIASIKETGEELSQDEWARFDAAVEQVKAERERVLRQVRDAEEDEA